MEHLYGMGTGAQCTREKGLKLQCAARAGGVRSASMQQLVIGFFEDSRGMHEGQ